MKKLLIGFSLGLLGSFFIPSQAHASVLYENFSPATTVTTYVAGTTTVSGTIKYVTMLLAGAHGFSTNLSYELRERDNDTGTYGSCNSIDALTGTQRGVPEFTSFTPDVTEMRQITFEMSGLGCTKSAGSKASFYPYVNGNVIGGIGQIGATGSATGLQYMVVQSDNVASTSRITNIYEPLSASISTSTTVIFDFEYFNNDVVSDVYEYSGTELTDTTVGTNVLTIEKPILTSGLGEYRKSVLLQSGHQYIWRPYLRTASSTKLYGDFNIFSVVTNPNPFSDGLLDISTTTASTTVQVFLMKYLSLKSLIENKYPVSYLPQMIALLQDNATLEGAVDFPSLTLEFDNYDHSATTSLEVFSTTTIAGSFPPTVLSTARTMISYSVWISFILFVTFDFLALFKPRNA